MLPGTHPSFATVRLLRQDPDLGAALSEAERQRAQALVTARVLRLGPGPWPDLPPAELPALGYLVLDGLLGARIALEGRAHLELLGDGDVLQPWVKLGDDATTPSSVDWQALTPVTLAVLDRRLALAIGRWPEIQAALLHRLVLRSRRLCFQLAVNAMSGVEDRLLISLWQLAERWGRVTPAGVTLRLPLTHAQLGEVVGATRPTVSTALMRLRQLRALELLPGGGWRLQGPRPDRYAELKTKVGLAA